MGYKCYIPSLGALYRRSLFRVYLLAVAEALNPNKPNQTHDNIHEINT